MSETVLPAGSDEQIVGVVGRVAEKNNGLMRHIADGFGNCQLRIGVADYGIVEPGKPESCAGALDRHVSVMSTVMPFAASAAMTCFRPTITSWLPRTA